MKMTLEITGEIQEEEYLKYKADIMDLIDKLLSEKIFIEDAEQQGFGKIDDTMREIIKKPSDQKNDKMEPEFRSFDRIGKDQKTSKTQRKKKTCLVGKFFLEKTDHVNNEMARRNWKSILSVENEDKLMLKKSEIPVINSSEVKRSNDEVNI